MKIYTRVVFSMTTLRVMEEDSFEYEGDIAYMKGSSGAIEYPTYQEDIHVNWLTGGSQGSPAASLTIDLQTVLNLAMGSTGNPYQGESPHNPIAELTTNQDRFNTADVVVKGVDPEGDWSKYVDTAANKLDSIFTLETEITNEVDNFEANVKRRRMREISRWAGGMADINAVESSQFIIGMAIREGEVTSEINQFESKLRFEMKRAKVLATLQATSDMIKLMLFKVDAGRGMTQLQTEINRVNIIANKERDRDQLEIDTLQASWDLEVFQYGISALGGLGGGVQPGVKGLSKAESSLAGAASGASIGSSFGSVGTGVGAVVGAVTGYLSGE